MSTEIQMKTCNICYISKSLNQFTGRYAKCNACRSKERRQLSQPSKQSKLNDTYHIFKLEYTFNYLNLAVNADFQKLTDEFNKQILALVKKYKGPSELLEEYNKLYSEYIDEYEEARSKLRRVPININKDDWVSVKSKIDELYKVTFEENTLDSDFVSHANAVVKPHVDVQLELDNLMRYLAYYSLDNIKPEVLDLFNNKIDAIYQKLSDDEKRRKEALKKITNWELPYYTRAKVTVEK